MRISLTRRIWLTVATIIIIFTVLVLYIVPNQQEAFFTKTFHKEAENLCRTVALGVNIALDEENLDGVAVAIDFAKDDKRLVYLAMTENDTIWDKNHNSFTISRTVSYTYPAGLDVNVDFEIIDGSKTKNTENPGKLIIQKKHKLMFNKKVGGIIHYHCAMKAKLKCNAKAKVKVVEDPTDFYS